MLYAWNPFEKGPIVQWTFGRLYLYNILLETWLSLEIALPHSFFGTVAVVDLNSASQTERVQVSWSSQIENK